MLDNPPPTTPHTMWDNQTLSDRQEVMLSVASRLSEQDGNLSLPESTRGVLAAWIRREAYQAAAEAAELRSRGVRIDAADAVAEDNSGFLIAATFVDCLGD